MNCDVLNMNVVKRSIGFLIHWQLLQLIQGLQAINYPGKKAEQLGDS